MNDIKGIIEDVEKSSLVSNKVIKKVIEIIGQEKWQDINDEEDDICTTAGELSITLKNIEELEKENAELTKEVEKHKWNNIFLEDCAVYDKKIAEEYTTLKEQITELEKRLEYLNNFHCEVVEAFVSQSPRDDFEMACAGREIFELLYPDDERLKDIRN